MDSLLKIIKERVNEILEQTIWKERVKKNPKVLEDVPEEYITQEMCDSVFEKIERLSCIPLKFRTLEMCRKAVQKNPKMLKDVPEMFNEDSEIIKAITCEVCGSKEDDVFDIRKCEDCCFECTATLCDRH